MKNAVNHFLTERAAQPLPLTAKTRSGVEFSPGSTRWKFRDSTTIVNLNFELLPDLCSSLLPGLKKTLLWFLENRAPSNANRLFVAFLWLTRLLSASRKEPIQHIGSDDILSCKMSSAKAEHRLANIRSFLIKWYELGAPGVDKDAAGILSSLLLKNNPVGVAVGTLDPRKGPLSDLEFEAIQAALNNAYERDEISSEDILLCYLLLSLGVRPEQLALLKCCDLIMPTIPDGDYLLKVPRAKQQMELARSEFKVRKLTSQLGEPLAAHVARIRAEFAGHLEDTNNAPMFPQRNMVTNANATGLEYHATAHTLTIRVIRLFGLMGVPSERLEGQPIPMNSIRFRRTFATRAAEEGWPLLVLAELMDHSDTRHVEVYTGLTTRIRATFSRKIAMDMAPVANAFAGRIIRSEEEATRPGPASRIIDLRVDRSGASMGSCGSHAHCSFLRPIACYAGCYDFEPWLDGPHDAALDYMLALRERLIATTDPRIAAINDRAILGCAQVILRCRQIMTEEK